MFINELPSGEPASGQVLAVDDGTETYKIDYDALADAIINKMLSSKVANDLVTTAAGLVLDARQGKALKDLHDTNANAIASLNSRTNFGNSVSYNETPNNKLFIRQGDTVYFSFQGENKARSESQLLFTVPQGYRPTNTIYISGTLGTVPCVFAFRENGQCSIYTAASYPTGRAYLRGSYLV